MGKSNLRPREQIEYRFKEHTKKGNRHNLKLSNGVIIAEKEDVIISEKEMVRAKNQHCEFFAKCHGKGFY
jgi:hypothetical protein